MEPNKKSSMEFTKCFPKFSFQQEIVESLFVEAIYLKEVFSPLQGESCKHTSKGWAVLVDWDPTSWNLHYECHALG